MATFGKLARQRSAAPAARRKAVATLKRTLARKKREAKAADQAIVGALNRLPNRLPGRTEVFNIADLPSKRPPKKRTYVRKAELTPYRDRPTIAIEGLRLGAGPVDRVQLAQDVVALLIKILK
jgi:hypothetical protein